MMRRSRAKWGRGKRGVTIALIGIAFLGVACSEEPTSGPTAEDYKAERARVQAQMRKNQTEAAEVAKIGTPKPAPESSLGGFRAVTGGYSYDPKGRRDPFETYRYGAGDDDAIITTPLMAYELEQLSVVAVIWSVGNRRALVSDPRGDTHLVKEGSAIGKNDGLVIHIGDNMVLVKETYVDFAGEMTTKDVELRIRKSQGG